MAHQNEHTDIALNELKAHGIKGHLRDLGSGHIEVSWQVCPEKAPRTVVAPKTSSDWRSRMNLRAEVRRALRADNVQLKMEHKPKKQPVIEKALSLPAPDVIPVPDQIAALRTEVADLTALVLRLTKITATVRDNVATYVPKPQQIAPVPQSSRSIKLVEYLSHDRWTTIDTLPRDTGLKPEQIKMKLQYLKNHDQIEIFRGQVKLKAAAVAEKKMHWKTRAKLEREQAAQAAARAAEELAAQQAAAAAPARKAVGRPRKPDHELKHARRPRKRVLVPRINGHHQHP